MWAILYNRRNKSDPLDLKLFLDTHVSLAPTHVRVSVRDTFEFPFYQCVSLVALREKLKKADPNYFPILGLGRIS